MTDEERHAISLRLMMRGIPSGWYRTTRGTVVASIGPPVPREDPSDLASPRFHSADAEFFGPDAVSDATEWILEQAHWWYPDSMAACDDDLRWWNEDIEQLAIHAAAIFGENAVHEATARVRRATIPVGHPRTAASVAACLKATKEELGPRAATALHEAAHAVINYRATGCAGGAVSIAPSDGSVGHAIDCLSESTGRVALEARVLSCYAGACSQRRFEANADSDSCDLDDEIAVELLRSMGCELAANEFRARAQAMVDHYWQQIVAVAAQLWERDCLDNREVEIVCDQVAGDADADALDAYRRQRAGPPASGTP